MWKRAIRDTLAGQITALIVLILGGCLSLGYLYVTESPTVAVEEIPYVSAAVAGAIGALSLLFLWNLACAPYRIERDKRIAAEAERDELASRVLPNSRQLTPSQKMQISDFIRGKFPSDADFMILSFQNEECLDLAQQFTDAIKDAGYRARIETNLIGGPISPAFRDVAITEWQDSDKDLVQDFSDILSNFGMKHYIRKGNRAGFREPFRILISRQSWRLKSQYF